MSRTWVLATHNDSDYNAFSGFGNPDRVVINPHEVTVEGWSLKAALPSMSIATVVL